MLYCIRNETTGNVSFYFNMACMTYHLTTLTPRLDKYMINCAFLIMFDCDDKQAVLIILSPNN